MSEAFIPAAPATPDLQITTPVSAPTASACTTSRS
jgi:hypothetical protein